MLGLLTSFQTWQKRKSQTMERATRVIRRSPRRHTDPAVVPLAPTAADAAPAAPPAKEQPLPAAIDTAQYGEPGWLPEKLEI